MLLGVFLAVSLAASGCQGESVEPRDSDIVTNEPLIDGSREGNHADLWPSSAEENSEGDSASKTDATSEPTIEGKLPHEGELSAIERDAQHYAEQYDVELSEAVDRLMLQGEIGELGAEIESREADTLAGFWIQHEPEYRVVVAFTKDGESTIAKYVKDGPLQELIEVRTAEATLRYLQDAQMKASRLVHGTRIPDGVWNQCARKPG